MTFRDEKHELKVEIRTDSYHLSEREKQDIEADLGSLRKVARDFPVSQLHLDIRRHPQRRDFHVRANLHVSKHNLFTGERGAIVTQAVESCVRKLVKKIKCFKEKHRGRPGETWEPTEPTMELPQDSETDPRVLARAVREADFPQFRDAIGGCDDSLSRQVESQIAENPELEALRGEDLVTSEILEEIYLRAFERFRDRDSAAVSTWIEDLIDPCIQSVAKRRKGS